ncbi:acetoacetate--CoA ligase [Dasania marina]|uniref:acetoacetate--CoA ligase n=1 Tax=Dasania marina TaxID=471499 RepID=UPI0030D9DC66|tara:strand:- start:134309 stop:136255 length:1947 start_codon:yes stop_codon:yes gene_type:complete
MNKPLWRPKQQNITSAQVTQFARLVESHQPELELNNYSSLYDWSVANPEDFWRELWDFCDVKSQSKSTQVLVDGDKMPGAKWFPEARLNFAENLLQLQDDSLAIIALLENGQRTTLTYRELYRRVAQLAGSLRLQGISAGDRVAGFMPNIPETIIAMLATTSIGAIWSSCSPDFGSQATIDRFDQIKPKVLIAVDGYFYNGKSHDCLQRLAEITQKIDSIEKTIIVSLVSENPDIANIPSAEHYCDFLSETIHIDFAQLPFDHPIYIMYSSGTTGKPKCIVHGAGGTLLQHLKEHRLAVDLKKSDVFFYFTTCGWMMWNWLVSGLASGATLVLYDGSPFAKKGLLLLDTIDSEGITIFGTSAKYIAAIEAADIKPKQSHKLSSLRTILSTGSPLSHESFEYVYRDIKDDVCLSSISGGTDIISCFVLGSPILPVYVGEIQCRGLAMAVEFWDDDGNSLKSGKGELVCVKPFVCMPVGFWNDLNGEKYHSAYFEKYSNIWHQGDYGELTENGGVIIHGRSDTVLNPGGVRIGTAEIYRQVENMEDVIESIAIGQEWNGDVRVVLFVVLRDGITLDDDLKNQIKTRIRKNTTPRHVPEKIIQVSDIPRTLSGKIVELAVRNVVHGKSVKNTDSLANPEALALYKNLKELS